MAPAKAQVCGYREEGKAHARQPPLHAAPLIDVTAGSSIRSWRNRNNARRTLPACAKRWNTAAMALRMRRSIGLAFLTVRPTARPRCQHEMVFMRMRSPNSDPACAMSLRLAELSRHDEASTFTEDLHLFATLRARHIDLYLKYSTWSPWQKLIATPCTSS